MYRCSFSIVLALFLSSGAFAQSPPQGSVTILLPPKSGSYEKLRKKDECQKRTHDYLMELYQKRVPEVLAGLGRKLPLALDVRVVNVLDGERTRGLKISYTLRTTPDVEILAVSNTELNFSAACVLGQAGAQSLSDEQKHIEEDLLKQVQRFRPAVAGVKPSKDKKKTNVNDISRAGAERVPESKLFPGTEGASRSSAVVKGQ